MKIIFKSSEKNIAEFTVDKTLSVRINKDKKRLVIKLRNNEYEKTGIKLKIENENLINSLSFIDKSYNNLSYVSSELYIHESNEQARTVVEDLTLTFDMDGE